MNTQLTPISDRIVSQFRKGEATSDGLILTMVELELKIAAICRERDEAREAAENSKAYKRVLKVTNAVLKRERDEARAESIRWQSIAEGRGRTDDDDTGKAMSNLIRQRDEAREALRDMLSGWRYIRQVHGDLYGVGWDRSQIKAEKALEGAK
jgi:hypothetical protein